MSNSLDRDIEYGEIVVVNKSVLKTQYQKLSSRLFLCQNGFGMQSNTAGKTIYGYWVDSPEDTKKMDMMISGYEISKDETEKYQEKYGKTTSTKGR